MKYFLCIACGMLYSFTQAQVKVRKLPNTINHPSINVYAPYISLDANALAFISDNAEDNALTLYYTFRENSDWKNPVMAPKQINSRLNFLKGYALSADGSKLYYTSMKSPVIGGYDIFVSEFKNNAWGEPKNMGLPINSKGNDANPSFTFDGNTLYFMRCEKMTQEKADGCKIFMAKRKPNGMWEEPVELPATVNSGNSQTPRIGADGETLIFSSNKISGGKGGMDLYMTRNHNGVWINPVAFDFINTEGDDQYVSVNALGRYLLKDAPGGKKNEIDEYLIPDNIRPKGVVKIDGKALDPLGKPTPAYVSVLDVATKKRIYSERPDVDGSFLVYLLEGGVYELSVDPEVGNMTYFAKQFDFTTDDKLPQTEKVKAILKPVAAGDEIVLDIVKFKEHTSELELTSLEELKRLARLIKKNPQLKFEIQVLLSGYQQDAVQSADLTEMISDSVYTKVDDIDSLGQLFKHDSLTVRITYNNDRTGKQAQTIINYLVSQGVDNASLRFFRNAIEAITPENRKLAIKVVARAK